MKISNLLIHLHNRVDAFSIKPHQVELIGGIFPDTRIYVATGTSDFLEKLPEADCALVWSFKSDWYEGAQNLKALFTPAAGHDWVAVDPSGRVRTFYGSFHGRIMRESLLSMMLHFNRQIGKSLADQKKKIWGRLDYNECVSLFNQRILIVGFGSLGQSMAELLKAFGARIIAVKRDIRGFGGNHRLNKLENKDKSRL